MRVSRVPPAALVCLCVLFGCGVDDRKLSGAAAREGIGGAGGVDDGAGGHGGDGDASLLAEFSDCGEGGAAGASSGAHCWTFDDGSDGWKAEPGIEPTFSTDDVNGDPNSGSLTLEMVGVGSGDTLETAGVYQCFSVPYAKEFSLDVSMLVPSQAVVGGASVELDLVNVPGCQGIVLWSGQFADPKPLSWQRIRKKGEVPRGTRSALFKLRVDKFPDEPVFTARFDQVRLAFE